MSFASSNPRGGSSSNSAAAAAATSSSSSSTTNLNTTSRDDLFRELDKLKSLSSDSEKVELLHRVFSKFSSSPSPSVLFASNAQDNKKNVFHYMALVNNVADLKNVFIQFAQLSRKLNRPKNGGNESDGGDGGNNPLFQRLAVGYTPVEYAVLKENKAYALLVMDEILRNKELSFQDVQNHILIGLYNEALLAPEDTKAIIKQLHNAVIEYLLEQFDRFSEQEKQYVVEYIVSVVNNELLHYPSKHDKTPPLIHGVIGLANTNAAYLESILTKVSSEKLKRMDEYTDKHGDYALFYALRNVHNKTAFPIFHVLLDKFDLEKMNARHGCNIFHKVFRNKFASSVPAILEILLHKFQSSPTLQELMRHLLLQQDKAGNSPLADAVKFRIFNREHDAHILEAVTMIIDLFPDIGYPLHVTDQQRSLLDIVMSSTERCRDVLGQYIVRRCREENKKGAMDVLRRNGMSYKEPLESSSSSRHRERDYSARSSSPLMKRHRMESMGGYSTSSSSSTLSSSSSRYAEDESSPFKRQRLDYSQQPQYQQRPQHQQQQQHYNVMDSQQQQQQQQHAYMHMYASPPAPSAASQYLPQQSTAYAPTAAVPPPPPASSSSQYSYVPQYSFSDSLLQQPLVPALAPTDQTAQVQVDSVKNFLSQIAKAGEASSSSAAGAGAGAAGDTNLLDVYKKLEEEFVRYREQTDAVIAALRSRVRELETDKSNLQLQLSQYTSAVSAPPSSQQQHHQIHDVQKILRMLSESATTVPATQ